MDKLIQTGVCSIIYGTFRGKKDQELFRCPRELDNVDIPRYVDEHRALLGFKDDDTEDLRTVNGKDMIGYYRMYYRGGWCGRWMLEKGVSPDEKDCAGVNQIIDWLVEKFDKGCDYFMKDYFSDNHKKWGGDERYLISPLYSSKYKVMVDTTYGNGDYPVRIYVYHDKEE